LVALVALAKAPLFEARNQRVERTFDYHRQISSWIGVTQQSACPLQLLFLLGAHRQRKPVASRRKRIQLG